MSTTLDQSFLQIRMRVDRGSMSRGDASTYPLILSFLHMIHVMLHLFIVHVIPTSLFSILHSPRLQKFGNCSLMVSLDNNVPRQAVDCNVLVLLVQEYPQLIPQRRYVTCD